MVLTMTAAAITVLFVRLTVRRKQLGRTTARRSAIRAATPIVIAPAGGAIHDAAPFCLPSRDPSLDGDLLVDPPDGTGSPPGPPVDGHGLGVCVLRDLLPALLLVV